MELIELGPTKTYHLGEVDVPVLKGVSLSVARGDMVALMGASGSGKSTLMNILGCLDRPSSGQYLLEGREVSGLSAKECARLRNRMIGFVFQSFNLLSRMTAFENVLMPLMYGRDNLTSGRWNGAPARCSKKSAYRAGFTTGRRNSREANSSGWRLPAP